MKEEKLFTPREFLSKYQLPQLVCIHEAHLQQVNETKPRQITRCSQNSINSNNSILSPNVKSTSTKTSILSSLTNSVQQLPKQYLKKSDVKNDQNQSTTAKVKFQPPQIKLNKDDELSEEVFSEELIVDEEDYRNRFNTNTLASSDSGNASASSNCSENQYPSNLTPTQSTALQSTSSSTQQNSSTEKCMNKCIAQKPNIIKSKNGVNELTKSSSQLNRLSVRNEKKLLDLDQPFLLYKSYQSRQVIAHILDVNNSTAQETLDHFQRTGPALLIPESYKGWFLFQY